MADSETHAVKVVQHLPNPVLCDGNALGSHRHFDGSIVLDSNLSEATHAPKIVPYSFEVLVI